MKKYDLYIKELLFELFILYNKSNQLDKKLIRLAFLLLKYYIQNNINFYKNKILDVQLKSNNYNKILYLIQHIKIDITFNKFLFYKNNYQYIGHGCESYVFLENDTTVIKFRLFDQIYGSCTQLIETIFQIIYTKNFLPKNTDFNFICFDITDNKLFMVFKQKYIKQSTLTYFDQYKYFYNFFIKNMKFKKTKYIDKYTQTVYYIYVNNTHILSEICSSNGKILFNTQLNITHNTIFLIDTYIIPKNIYMLFMNIII